MIVRCREIEENGIAAAVKDHFAVSCAFDDNRLLGRPVCSEIESAIEQRGIRPSVAPPILTVDAGVNQNGVAWFHTRLERVHEVCAIRAGVVGGHQTVEVRSCFGPV